MDCGNNCGNNCAGDTVNFSIDADLSSYYPQRYSWEVHFIDINSVDRKIDIPESRYDNFNMILPTAGTRVKIGVKVAIDGVEFSANPTLSFCTVSLSKQVVDSLRRICFLNHVRKETLQEISHQKLLSMSDIIIINLGIAFIKNEYKKSEGRISEALKTTYNNILKSNTAFQKQISEKFANSVKIPFSENLKTDYINIMTLCKNFQEGYENLK